MNINEFYEKFYRIRRIEQVIAEIYPTDLIKSPIHLSTGQEGPSLAVCYNLLKNDIAFGTYRGHALYLAKGGSLKKMFAELFGKIDGVARGKGGSMHLIENSVNMAGTSAIVSSAISEAVGYALALKMNKNKKHIVVCFFGDGATNQGVFFESLNFASLKKLPILFVCENNDLAIHSKVSDRSVQNKHYKFAEVFNIKSKLYIDDNIIKLNQDLKKDINQVRKLQKPIFVEIKTNRWLEHVGPNEDWYMGYRSKKNLNNFLKDDPLKKLEKKINKNLKIHIYEKVENEIKQAIRFAKKSKFPNKNEVFKHVFKK